MIIKLLAVPSQAAPVRSLEHPEFSRLLLPVPPSVEWSLQHDGRSARLALRGPVPALELGGIFDRMPRSRIRAIGASDAADGATVTMELGCDCDLVVERLGETLLAVDVRSPGSARQPAPPERAAEDSGALFSDDRTPPRETAAATDEAGETPAAADPVPAVEPGKVRVDAPAGKRPEGAKFLSVSPESDAGAAGSLPPADDPVRLARDALVRQLERAAAEGLVELAPDAAASARDLTAARPEPVPPDAPLPEPALLPRLTPAPAADGTRQLLNSPPAQSVPDLPDLRVSPAPPPPPESAAADHPADTDPEATAASLLAHLVAREPVTEAPAPAAAGPSCPPDGTLDVRHWPQAGGDLVGALGDSRRGLLTEAGEIDAGAVRDLARLYITVGFGREASTLLKAAGLAGGGDPLHDLARLVEGRPAASDGVILGAQGCSGRVLMWRAVAGAEPLDRDSSYWPTIREGLMELPPLLRRLVGQDLARQALLGDRPDVAREVIDLLDRTPGAEPQMETRIRAALAVSRGEAEYALTLIAPEIADRASPDPEALLLHARATLAGGTLPDPAVMTMLDTAIPGYDIAGLVGRALRLVRARLEASAGRPAEALEMVQKVLAASGGTNPDAIDTGRAILADLPADLRSGPVGARLILAHRNLLDKGAESRVLRLGYAEALIEGGLPNAALRLLATPGVLQNREARLVAARGHLLLGEDEEVFRLLEGLKNPSAARMRADVYRRAGDMAAAHAELAALAATDGERNATALLAREWEGLKADAVLAPYAPLAAYAAEQASADSATAPAAAAERPGWQAQRTLSAAQAALADARRLREAFGVAGPEG